ncbi:MAG: hypothetical protein IJ736_03630 [Firmicutes bacterium]|nr:hypothetical protein [Bacillota bacterium]
MKKYESPEFSVIEFKNTDSILEGALSANIENTQELLGLDTLELDLR